MIAVRLAAGTAPWACEARIAGLPLLVRLVRQLERAGVGAIALEAHGDTDRVVALEQLRAHGHRVAIRAAGEGPALDGAALYAAADIERLVSVGGALPDPVIRVRDAAAGQEAERYLWRSIRKTVAHDGPVAYYLARPVSGAMTRLLLRTRVGPNPITVLGLFVGLGAGVTASFGGYAGILGGALLFFVGLILDCVDGEIARLKLTTSRRGQWLDTIVDDLSVIALTAGVGVGLWRQTGAPIYLYGGVGVAGLVTLAQLYIYGWLARSQGPIDTAKYPWFFSGDGGVAQEGKRSAAGWLAFLFRRDSQSLLFVLLAAAGLGPVIFALLGGGGAIVFGLLLVDRLLKGLGVVEEPRAAAPRRA